MELRLEKTTIGDLETLFVFQTDEASNHMAAFTSENPNDKKAYIEKWTKIVTNPEINMQTIYSGEEILGSVIHFDMNEETNVSYWIDRKHWGKGICTKAFKLFLATATKRPLVGMVAFDNHGSQRVLEKCGFIRTGRETNFANARNKDIEEFIYILK